MTSVPLFPLQIQKVAKLRAETAFHYRQTSNVVWAAYEDGAIKFGTFVAKVLATSELEMRYSHINL